MSLLSVVPAVDGRVEKVSAGLSERLVWLTTFGKPSITKSTRPGWHGHIAMHVASKGTQFEISSDYDCATPDAAIEQLIERMLDTLAKIGKGEA